MQTFSRIRFLVLLRSRADAGYSCRKGILGSVFLLMTVSVQSANFPCTANSADDLTADFQSTIALYEEGWGGSDPALVEALERFGDLLTTSGNQSLVRAYYGSANVARARMVSDRQKPRLLRKGVAELDASVEAAPEDVQIRLLRAITLAVLPRLAGRMETAEDDFNWLVERAEDDAGLGADCRQAIFYHAGSFAVRNRDARAVDLLTRAAEIGPTGAIDLERVNRMLRLARQQVLFEDEEVND